MEHIIEQVKSGNTNMFEEVVITYQKRIYLYILKMIPNCHIAEELTQEVFVRAYTKLDKYYYEDSFKAWLYKIAKNTTLNFIKKRKFEELFLISYKQSDLYYEDSISCSHFDEKIENALCKLKTNDKNLLLLRSVEELSYEELANIYNTNQATIRKRYERVKRKFRKQYESKKEGINNARVEY